MPMSPRLLRPRAAGGFDPRTIADLALWYDASDASTVTLNGATVSEWRSKGLRSVALSQSTASRQPVYETSAVNGRAALTTGTSPRAMVTAGFPFVNTVTSFMVMALTGSSSFFYGAWYRGVLNTRHQLSIDNLWRARRGTNLESTAPVAFSPAYLVARCQFSGTLSQLTLNGLPRPENTGSGSYSSADQNLTMFSQAGFPNEGMYGGIAEFLYYERELSGSEVASVEQYLSRKYAITVA